jgi:hypothetical protein
MVAIRPLSSAWFRAINVGPAVLLVALLPMLLYAGHWGDMIGAAFGSIAFEEEASEHSSHQSHCHGGQASCSEQPLPANANGLQTAVELPQPELPTTSHVEVQTPPTGVSVVPPTDPPWR